MSNRAYKPLNQCQQQWLRSELASVLKSPKEVASAAGKSQRAMNDVLSGKAGFSDVWLTAFSSTLERDKEVLRHELIKLADPSADIQERYRSLTPKKWASEEGLFSDCLAALSFVECVGTPEKINECLDRVLGRLNEHPEDIFLRALASWAVLMRGTPTKIVAIVKETSSYLSAPSPATKVSVFDLDQENWKQTIDKIRANTIEEPDLVRRHLEDALMRVALLRWLKSQGSTSALAARIGSIAARQDMPLVVESIFDGAKSRSERDWLSAALIEVNKWIDSQHTCGLAHVFLLWLTGREGNRDNIAPVIDRTCDWIDENRGTNDSLVRWGTIWLAGMASSRVDRVLRQTRTWLRTAASDDDRLVRMSLLWLAGARGNSKQVAAAIADGVRWLRNPRYRHDSCIRVALLVWLMRRGLERRVVKPKQFLAAIADSRRWLKKHDDPVVSLALCLAESVVSPS